MRPERTITIYIIKLGVRHCLLAEQGRAYNNDNEFCNWVTMIAFKKKRKKK